MTAGSLGEVIEGSFVSEPDQYLIQALCRDPPIHIGSAAHTLPQAIPSGGVNLNAVLYTAAGSGPHPTMLLLHGLPGNEQNVDLAQTVRRTGWNVLTIHYRGSWGGPGDFRFEHCLQDAAAALDWIREVAGDPALKLDPQRAVVVGHSMGGFVAAHTAAERPEIKGVALISGVDLGRAFGDGHSDRSTARVDENVGVSAGLHILAGTSPPKLANEARINADRWRLTNYAPHLADRPVLIVTADDGFAAGSDALAHALRAFDGVQLTHCHFAADHSYSDCRIGLQVAVLEWLAKF
jgi:pimeloyl-ACP methyl ester carboxylesterase